MGYTKDYDKPSLFTIIKRWLIMLTVLFLVTLGLCQLSCIKNHGFRCINGRCKTY